MTEKNALKMNLDHERKIVELQSRVNKLENLCYMTKEVLNLEEASAFLGIAKSTFYKMTHLNQLPYFKPAGMLSERIGMQASSSSLRRKPCLTGCVAQEPCRRRR